MAYYVRNRSRHSQAYKKTWEEACAYAQLQAGAHIDIYDTDARQVVWDSAAAQQTQTPWSVQLYWIGEDSEGSTTVGFSSKREAWDFSCEKSEAATKKDYDLTVVICDNDKEVYRFQN